MTADQSRHGPSPGGSHIVELVALWILFGAHSSVGFGLRANYKLTLPWISFSTNQHSQQRVSLNPNPNFLTPLLFLPLSPPFSRSKHPHHSRKKTTTTPARRRRTILLLLHLHGSRKYLQLLRSKNTLIRSTSTAMTKRNVVVSDSNSTIFSSHTYPPNPTKLFAISRNKKLLKKLETGAGGRINGWVDSMKASSPTHLKSSILDQDPDSWIIDHPSALSMFEQIMNASNGKQIVMFLDYDGTLSPIVEDPDRAFMSDAMRAAVQQVAGYFPTAIVSGRCRDKVYSFVGLAELYYAGSHGMDIKGPSKNLRTSKTSSVRSLDKTDNQAMLFQPASEFLPMIDEVYEALVEKTKSTPGAKVENNKFCVSVHFRCVDEKRWNALAEQVRSVLKEYPKLRLTQGRKVLEIRPTIKWDKGKALEFLLDSLGFTNCNDVLPVYIGDDRTDEDAFKVLRKRGQGFGILVSKIPKATNASYSLQEPAEVMDFLHRLVQWKQHQSLQVCKKL